MVKLFTKYVTGISQSVKDLTFRKLSNKAGQVLQTKPIPRNPNSPAQQARRQAYSRLCYLWSANKIKDKDCYIDIAKKMRLDKTNFYLSCYLDILSYEPAICFDFSQPAGELVDLSGKAQSKIYEQEYSNVQLKNGKIVCQMNGTSDWVGIKATDEINNVARYNSTYFIVYKLLSLPSTYAVIWEEGGVINGMNILICSNEVCFNVYNNQPNTTTYYTIKMSGVELNKWYVTAIRFDNTNNEIVSFIDDEQLATTWTPPLNIHPAWNGLGRINYDTNIFGTTYSNADGYYFYANAQLAHFSILNKALSDQKIYKQLKKLSKLVEES